MLQSCGRILCNLWTMLTDYEGLCGQLVNNCDHSLAKFMSFGTLLCQCNYLNFTAVYLVIYIGKLQVFSCGISRGFNGLEVAGLGVKQNKAENAD